MNKIRKGERMIYRVKVAISNRHVHLTKDIYDKLFDEPMSKRNDLNQIGQYATNQTVDLIVGDKVIEHVRVVGPYREYTQVEILPSDAELLGLNPPTRRSGELNDAETITIKTDKGSVTLNNACIIAENHVHFNTNEMEKYHVQDKQLIKVHLENGTTFDARAKVSDDGYYELQVDRDVALKYGLSTGQEVDIEI